MNPRDLPDRWRSEADRYDLDGVPGHAAILRRVATELAIALAAVDSELLTISEAAIESGYTGEHLARLVRESQIPNAGVSGSPRIRRADLPRKPGSGLDGQGRSEPVGSASQVVRSVLSNGGQG